jgi:broad specificity phosphatase PhoE
MTLHLVRHGRPLVDRERPAHEWPLDPEGYDDVVALGARLPEAAAWYCSPEPKAVETAQLLTDGPVGIIEALAEHRRGAGWVEDFGGTVRRAFEHPDRSAHEGWEPLTDCRQRVALAGREILAAHPTDEVVLVGHGTAWTLLVAELTGRAPDLDRWAALAMPDVIEIPPRDLDHA